MSTQSENRFYGTAAPVKVEIERRSDDQMFNVRVGDRYDNGGLNREEALGCVVEFLYLGQTHFYLGIIYLTASAESASIWS